MQKPHMVADIFPKNSFWASMRENNKRRIWLWMISVLFWFFYYPVCMAMLMSRKQGHNRIDGLTGAAAKERLTAMKLCPFIPPLIHAAKIAKNKFRT